MAGLLVVTNGKISFAFLVLLQKSLCSVGELNFSQDFMDERSVIASVTETLFKVSFVLKKISLTELVLKRRNASPLIKRFFVMNGWQDENCVY